MGQRRPSFACIALVAVVACGCAPDKNAKQAAAPRIFAPAAAQNKPTPAEVQQATLVFADRFIAALAESCDDLERSAATSDARVAAQSRKVGAALAAMKNAVQTNPYAGLLDTVVMVTLLRDTADSAAMEKYYGAAAAARLKDALQQQQNDVYNVASRFFTKDQLQELRQSIDQWRKTHPGANYVSFVRLNDFPETRQMSPGGGDAKSRPNSVFGLLFLDPFSGMDPAVKQVELSRQLAERMFYYFQRMPIVISWQANQLYGQMLAAPEVQTTLGQTTRFVDGTTRFAGSSSRFADATDAFARTCEQFRLDLAKYRTDTLRDLEQMTDRQRDVAIRQATTQISAERDAALKQVAELSQALAQTLRVEQEKVVDKLRGATATSIDRLGAKLGGATDQSIDRLYGRLWRLIALAIAGVFAAAVAWRLLFGRRRARLRDPEKDDDGAGSAAGGAGRLGAVARS